MLTTNQSYVTYQGNGATTVFPYNFIIPSTASAVVSITNTATGVTSILGSSQYTITGIGSGGEFSGGSGPGGNVTYPVSGNPLPAGYTITIQRVVPYQQSTSLTNQGAFYPNVVEACLDNLTMQTQQLAAVQAGVPALNSLTTAATQANTDDSSNIATTAFVQNQKISGGTGYVNLQYPGYGVDPTGTNDSTSAIQAALNTGYVVFAPPGTYKFGSSGVLLSFSAGGIIGAGQNQTAFTSPDVSSNSLISYTGYGGIVPVFRDFTLIGSASKASGFGIYMAPSSNNQLLGAIIDNVGITTMPDCIGLINTAGFSVTRCSFAAYTNYGLVVENAINPDSGDSQVIGNWFVPGSASTYNGAIGILQYSSGGLRILGNKFNTGGYAYILNLNSIATSIFLFEGNSVENLIGGGLSINRASGTGTFSHFIITGNEFSNNTYSLQTDASGAWNDIIFGLNSLALANGQYGLILNSGTNFRIESNLFGGAGTSYGIVTQSACTNGRIGPQSFVGVSSPITNNSTGVIVERPTLAAGTVTLSSGTGTATIPSGCTYAFGTDTTAANAVKCVISGTTLTITGTGSDVINYQCF